MDSMTLTAVDAISLRPGDDMLHLGVVTKVMVGFESAVTVWTKTRRGTLSLNMKAGQKAIIVPRSLPM